MNKYLALVISVLTCLFVACDTDELNLGESIMPDQDNVTTTPGVYRVKSYSVETKDVVANTNVCYLGAMIDPETRSQTSCDFLAQFHVMENFKLPKYEAIQKHKDGRVKVDSCYITLLYSTFYGDSLSSMRVTAEELSREKFMEENVVYTSAINPDDFRTSNPRVRESVTCSARDLTQPDMLLDFTKNYRSINIVLPNSYAEEIFAAYYAGDNHDDHSAFRNSYSFIHKVCPGFYFKSDAGVGTMYQIESANLNFEFEYLDSKTYSRDTILTGFQCMAATQEVLQNTHTISTIPSEMLDKSNPYTYVKSPAGIHTELELPISDIVGGEHYNDTINSVFMTIRRVNSEDYEKTNLMPPGVLLMLPKAQMRSFFEKPNVADGQWSYTASYDYSKNSYDFSNIGRLIVLLKSKRDNESGVLYTDTEAQRKEKYAVWEQNNPDWNKVVLLPVTVETQTTNNSSGSQVVTPLRVNTDFSLKSVKLEGGETGNLKLNVIYSRFAR